MTVARIFLLLLLFAGWLPPPSAARAQPVKVWKQRLIYNCRNLAGQPLPVYFARTRKPLLAWASASLNRRVHLFVNTLRRPDVRGVERIFMFYSTCALVRRFLQQRRRLAPGDYLAADCAAWRRMARRWPVKPGYRQSVTAALERFGRERVIDGRRRARAFRSCRG